MAILDIFKKGTGKVDVVRYVDDAFDVNKDMIRQMLERLWWRNLLYYCLAEGTKIPLLDGQTVHIEDLVGEEGWVYGFDLNTLQVVPAWMSKVVMTGKKPCVEVSLDNGNSFVCTADHRILTWFGYKEAQELGVGTPLVPYHNKYFKSSGGNGGYTQVFQPYDAEINCRMVGIRPVGIRRVFDASVPSTSNFALDAGVYVHNCGEQWVEWYRGTNTFRRRNPLTPGAAPVSNKIRDFVRAVKAQLLNQRLVPRVAPNTEEYLDKAAAQLGSNLLLWMDTLNEGEIEDEKEMMIIMLCLCGTGFLRSIPYMEGGEWFVSKKGEVRTTGEVITENIIPFNVRVSMGGSTLRKKMWVGVQTLREKEWVEDTFNIKVTRSDPGSTLDYQKNLMTLVSQVSLWKGQGFSYTTNETQADVRDMVMLRELEFRPTLKYPNGRYVATCGGEVLVDMDRLPVRVEKGMWFYTLTDFHFHRVPGRFWSDAGVDDLISPQNTINEIDKALADNRKSLGRPMVLVPSELTMKRMSDHGDNVLVLQYDAQMSGGARPSFNQGIPLPEQTVEERQLQEKQIQDRGGDPKNVLQGQVPSAHASGVLTEMLQETARQGHQPDVERYNRAMQRVYKVRLLIANEIMTEKRMIKVVGVNNQEKVIPFKRADLRDNTDVRLELDSGVAVTNAGKREVLLALVKEGWFNPQTPIDPAIRQDIERRLGLSGFVDPTNHDLDRAEMENGMVAGGNVKELFTVELVNGKPDPNSKVRVDDPLFKYDNHSIHYESHRRFILTPDFKELELAVQAAMIVHTDVHHMRDMADKQAQMEQMVQIQAMAKGGGMESGTPTLPTGERQGGPTQ